MTSDHKTRPCAGFLVSELLINLRGLVVALRV
ncbi:hypothetical protein KNU96_gp45 [Xanthomonas phage FoX5]|uniref:Uncharacterized protein n=1 Tax=Xanthomonas phage FoX5 TaxID=2723901 RepID=A0A858NQ56_9CAUD|nr:hypothetical protein KNU96_gp45 [Xanthomonas phage FoX5]QJB22045.1 hypothetical protein XccvBFoX5_gp67 [Xanthomonas phage FoX5]